MDKLEEKKKLEKLQERKKQEQQHTIADTNDCLCLFLKMLGWNQIHCYIALKPSVRLRLHLNPKSAETLKYDLFGDESMMWGWIKMNSLTVTEIYAHATTTGCQTSHTLPFPDPLSSSCIYVKSCKIPLMFVTQKKSILFIRNYQIYSTVTWETTL